MRQLFDDPNLRELDVRLSIHELAEQARLVSQGKLDLAAVVMAEDAELLQTMISQYDLEIATFPDLEGLVARHPWLGLGHVAAGRFDLVRPTPAVDKPVIHVDTLVLGNPCAQRAERVALLMLLNAELPGFVAASPPKHIYSATSLPLARPASQFFIKGEPEIADVYFPWAVNLLSPVYWVYLAMAVTTLSSTLRGISRFELWRIDAARERLEKRLKELTDPKLTHAQIRAFHDGDLLTRFGARTAAQSIRDKFVQLRARCQRFAASIVTPDGRRDVLPLSRVADRRGDDYPGGATPTLGKRCKALGDSGDSSVGLIAKAKSVSSPGPLAMDNAARPHDQSDADCGSACRRARGTASPQKSKTETANDPNREPLGRPILAPPGPSRPAQMTGAAVWEGWDDKVWPDGRGRRALVLSQQAFTRCRCARPQG
jgi:hypothetical protein